MLFIVLALLFAVSFPQAHAAAGAQILSHTGYSSSIGSYDIVGEIVNTGDQALHEVKVTATYYDQSGDIVGTGSGYTMIGVLLPNRKSPFNVLFESGQASKIDHYGLDISYSATAPIPMGLSILSNSSYIGGDGSMHVTGEVKNLGTVKAMYVQIIVTCYNSTGGVVAADYGYSNPHDLEPNQIAPFDVLLLSERVPYTHHYTLTADSTQYAAIPEFSNLVDLAATLVPLAIILLARRKDQHPVASGK